MSDLTDFIMVKNSDLTPDIDNCNSYSKNVYVQVNPFKRDEVSMTEYVKASKYYEVLHVLNELTQLEMRKEELLEKAAGVLLDS